MTNIAPSLPAVADRVERFFESDSIRMVELRRDIISKLEEIGDVIVVGGLVRDLALFGAKGRPISDIDFVVTGRPRKLDLLATKLGAKANRFGGYGLCRDGFKIDFWSLHRTWAKTNHHAKVTSAKDLVKTTFFDWDGVVFNLSSGEIFSLPKYLDRLNSKIIDINLLENPSVHGNLVRALRRIVMWDAKPSRQLRHFIDENIHQYSWDSIIQAEVGVFTTIYLKQFRSAMEFRHKALAKRNFTLIGVDSGRQSSFEFYQNGKDSYKI